MRHALVEALRARSVDVLTALEAGMIGRADEEHLGYVITQSRVLCSFNVEYFYRLHTTYVTESKSHAGMILARQQRYSVGKQMRRLLKLLATKSADDK